MNRSAPKPVERSQEALPTEYPPLVLDKLPLSVRKILDDDGIKKLTQVQELSYGPVRDGRDVLARSETGSGKTLAFCLPMADFYEKNRGKRSHEAAPTVLILCPTRELCQQVARVFARYLKPFKKKVGVLVGGESYDRQARFIRFGIDVIVGTPGRVTDFLQKQDMTLSCLDYFILDEVDQMLEIGFEEQLNYIHYRIRRKVQTLFFSATLNRKSKKLAQKFLSQPFDISPAEQQLPAGLIHGVTCLKQKNRYPALLSVFNKENPQSALIFCETRADCLQLKERLLGDDYRVSVIHGDLEQKDRQIALNHFRHGRVDILIATNVLARGIDVDELPLVINYSMPKSVRDYTHRAGRTARAGKSGTVWTLISPKEISGFKDICHIAGIKLKSLKGSRLEPDE